jgi:hypothetical protein
MEDITFYVQVIDGHERRVPCHRISHNVQTKSGITAHKFGLYQIIINEWILAR